MVDKFFEWLRDTFQKKLPLIITGVSVSILLLSAAIFPRVLPLLVKNFSSSEKRGFYVVRDIKRDITRGELLLVTFPEQAKPYVAMMPWLNENIPLLKRVGAVSQDLVCQKDGVLTVNGEVLVRVKKEDRLGRDLLSKKGCYQVPDGEFLPINTYSEDSFDGRYFGSISTRLIVGRTQPIMTF